MPDGEVVAAQDALATEVTWECGSVSECSFWFWFRLWRSTSVQWKWYRVVTNAIRNDLIHSGSEGNTLVHCLTRDWALSIGCDNGKPVFWFTLDLSTSAAPRVLSLFAIPLNQLGGASCSVIIASSVSTNPHHDRNGQWVLSPYPYHRSTRRPNPPRCPSPPVPARFHR